MAIGIGGKGPALVPWGCFGFGFTAPIGFALASGGLFGSCLDAAAAGSTPAAGDVFEPGIANLDFAHSAKRSGRFKDSFGLKAVTPTGGFGPTRADTELVMVVIGCTLSEHAHSASTPVRTLGGNAGAGSRNSHGWIGSRKTPSATFPWRVI